MSKSNFIKTKIRKIFKQVAFHIYKNGQKLGVSILPTHYYSPIPNIYELEKTKRIWARKSKMPGININLDYQGRQLKEICLPYLKEYESNKIYLEGTKKGFGPGYGFIEAQALHSVIRHFNPRKVIEVGSGISTNCILKALDLNKAKTELTCIEPYPSNQIKKLNKSYKIALINKKVQEVPLNIFKKLSKNDILFVDSSHTVKPGGDVNYLILEVLPRLKKGVIVHFHDIFFPYDYQRSVLKTFFHWAETSLLRAFLINNNNAEIIFSLSQLHYDKKDILKEVFPKYLSQSDQDGLITKNIEGNFPSSTYILIK